MARPAASVPGHSLTDGGDAFVRALEQPTQAGPATVEEELGGCADAAEPRQAPAPPPWTAPVAPVVRASAAGHRPARGTRWRRQVVRVAAGPAAPARAGGAEPQPPAASHALKLGQNHSDSPGATTVV